MAQDTDQRPWVRFFKHANDPSGSVNVNVSLCTLLGHIAETNSTQS